MNQLSVVNSRQKSFLDSLIFFIVSIVLTLKVAKRKKPVWAYKTTKIIGLGTNAPPELKLTFNGKPVNDVYQTTFILFNKGREAIRRDDVTENIAVHFEGAEILRQPIIKAKSNEAIRFTVNTTGSSVNLRFLYLDHEDGAVIEVLHTASKQISCTANIIGAKEIGNIGEFELSRPPFLFQGIRIMIPLMFVIIGSAILLYGALTSTLKEFALTRLALPLVLIIAAMLTYTPDILSYFRYKKFPKWSRNIPTEEASVREPIEAYCVKCKTQKEMKYPYVVKLKGGHLAVRGVCPDCGTNVFRMLPRP